ncbi:peptidylprolyl isomerase [Saccharobesus litoralis]|uniref:Peptidyl-prolyl cis-trans isomerase n=1 Tax=Saccharobesus litoralis TaxID=2172099 RepID=A0A2S0VW29_9ALTE|nr:peptidylprolyl isomerase [Saccharobesus litoralis]AWB68426.1 peptidylprolyl isomerase [Saccharobesus litoralis]
MRWPRLTISGWILLGLWPILCGSAQATVVMFKTNMGDFEVNLYDESVPTTVSNFLSYVQQGQYDNTIIHRAIPNFIIQGGGFYLTSENQLTAVSPHADIVNEPKFSNVRGTIAMAKRADEANSASHQWFFNIADNSVVLDRQNGGLSVFGQVDAQGLAILDKMAQEAIFNLDDKYLTNTPLRNYSAQDAQDGQTITTTNYIVVEAVVVVNSELATLDGQQPVRNVLREQQQQTTHSGAIAWLLLLVTLFAGRQRYI